MNNEDTINIIAQSAYFNLDRVYPVGSLFFTTSSLNPSELLGGGEWKRFGEGRVILSSSDSKPNGTTGGSETVTLTVNNLPSHSHSGSTNETGNHSHNRGNMEISGGMGFGEGCPRITNFSKWGVFNATINSSGYTGFAGNSSYKIAGFDFYASRNWTGTTNTTGNHSHSLSINNTGSSQGFSVMNPFISVNVWERIG